MKECTYTRRAFIQASTLAVAAAAGVTACTGRATKPNVLFLWTDEQKPDTMSVYGNPRIHTPNLNTLAGESAVFKRTYCTQPVCTPARASVLTGFWPHQTGCLHNNIPLPEDMKTFPEILDDPDYATGYMGKWHLGDEVFAQHGFQEWVAIEDGYIPYYSEGRSHDARSAYHQWLQDLGYAPDRPSGIFSREFAARLPFDHCKPEFLANQACDFLRRHRGEPFVLHVNYLEPHMPFFGPLDDKHAPHEVPLPASLDDPLDESEPLRNRIFRQWYYLNGWDGEPLRTRADWQRMIAKYWGLVAQVDHSAGRILQTLEDLGLAENTIVVYTSDHGDMMGAHRLFTKTFSHEESSRVPLLIRYPRKSRRQIVVEDPVSQIDLNHTLLDMMGSLNVDFGGPGKSLAPKIEGASHPPGNVFVQWNRFFQNLEARCRPEALEPFQTWLRETASQEEIGRAMRSQWRAVVSPDGWKLSLAQGDKSQLYHLREDPHECTNLFEHKEYAGVIARLRSDIHAWQESVGDPVEV